MYKIMRTDKAEDQLRDIIYYIADDSGSVDVALKYLDKIEEYPLLPKAIKDVLKENKFPIHKINNDLK